MSDTDAKQNNEFTVAETEDHSIIIIDDSITSPSELDDDVNVSKSIFPITVQQSEPQVIEKTEEEEITSHRSTFDVGFAEDRNKRYRKTMEDSHTFIFDYGDVDDQGFFGIYDGHAGRSAALWCGENLHKLFLKNLEDNYDMSIPEIFNLTFNQADDELDESKGFKSGCTSAACFLRTEIITLESDQKNSVRKLYCANAGDARIVLSRNGKAMRLTYDHKATDPSEVRRIIELRGYVVNDRVNGILAVTRSLGDSFMKEFITGTPYTSEIELNANDSFFILACDGLWDVCDDQLAVDLVSDIQDPQEAAEKLLKYALENFSTDNLSIMVVRLTKEIVK